MLSIEIDKRLRSLRIPPDLAEQASIRGTHQLLADNIETVRDVVFHDRAIVDECSFAFGAVVVDVVVQTLTHEVQAVEMVQSFDVGGEATTIFGVDLHLVWLEAGFWRFIERDCDASV